jgi:hypothetical protein
MNWRSIFPVTIKAMSASVGVDLSTNGALQMRPSVDDADRGFIVHVIGY